MLKPILLTAAGIVAARLACAAFKPDAFGLARSATIAAPPQQEFALLNHDAVGAGVGGTSSGQVQGNAVGR